MRGSSKNARSISEMHLRKPSPVQHSAVAARKIDMTLSEFCALKAHAKCKKSHARFWFKCGCHAVE